MDLFQNYISILFLFLTSISIPVPENDSYSRRYVARHSSSCSGTERLSSSGQQIYLYESFYYTKLVKSKYTRILAILCQNYTKLNK